MSDLTSPKKTTRRTDSKIEQIHDHGLDYQGNQIYLFPHDEDDDQGVESRMANKFIKNMTLLMAKSRQPILVHMQSEGGDWAPGMAIYDIIKHCPNQVTILNYSSASSMSSVIFQAADNRVMMPNSHFMFHYGSGSLNDANHKSFRAYVKEADRNIVQMLDVYAEAMKSSSHSEVSEWSITKIKRWLIDKCDRREDVFLSPEDTVKYGLADSIFTGDWESLY